MMPDAYHMPISIVHRALSIAPYALCMIHNAIFYALCISYAHTHKDTDMDLCVCVCVCVYIPTERGYRQFVTQCQALLAWNHTHGIPERTMVVLPMFF